MSLNEWSIVFFGFSFLYYLSLYYSMFNNPSPPKFIFCTVIWIINSFVTLVYGMATDQIGFILLFFLEWAMIILVFTATGKVLKNVDN